jgi:hypothetical protein
MTKARRVLLLCWPLFSGIACGGGDNIPIGDLDSKARDAICGLEVRCGQYPDKNTCAGATFTQLQGLADVSSGKVKYDGQAAADCLHAYGSLGCNISDQTDNFLLAQSCKDIFQGTVADGGACLVNEECISQNCNRSACDGTVCCAGACQPKLAAGGDCAGSGSICVDGTFCKRDATGATAVCVARPAAGQACDSSDICMPGLICNDVAGAGRGACGKAPAEGAACPGRLCDASSDFCDSTTRTCVHRTAVGGACASTEACVSYANCDAATMKCVARMAVGGACVTTNDCINGQPCTSGICVGAADVPACP